MSVEPDISTINWRLYAIIDRAFIKEHSAKSIAEQLLDGGAGVIQFRDKTANVKQFFSEALEVRQVTRQYGIPLIINDRIDIALAVDADGVHLGQDDLPLPVVKKLLNKNKIIGISVHNAEEFNKTVVEKPGYFGVGTIYSSGTKSHLPATGLSIIRKLHGKTNRPLIAIGGITLDNLQPVFDAGADGVAVISALLSANNIKESTCEFVRRIEEKKGGQALTKL